MIRILGVSRANPRKAQFRAMDEEQIRLKYLSIGISVDGSDEVDSQSESQKVDD